MNEKQKKVILIIFTILIILAAAAAVSLIIAGYVTKDDTLKLAGAISSAISPSMLLGIIIKIVLNNVFHNNIKKTLHNAGLKNVDPNPKELKNNFAIYKYGLYTFIEKENTIIIKTPVKKIEQLSELKDFQDTMPYYFGEKRRELQNPQKESAL